MKRLFFWLVCFIFIFFVGCTSTSSSKSHIPEPPRREFSAVETIDAASNEPFIVNEFIADGSSFSKGSVYFSTALFLSDIDVLDKTTRDIFKIYADTVFSQFPDSGHFKEIVIPNLSKSVENDVEKNAYLFITKKKNNDGIEYYSIESNIPIGSIFAKTYDGYMMRLDTGFYKNKIPASWTAIMNIITNNDILLYRGIAYPSKSAPLIYTGTGIGSDVRMNAIMSDKSSAAEIKDKLREIAESALNNAKPENQKQIDSMKFLEKSTNVSLSAYSYIDSKFEDAKKYYNLSQETIIDIPDDTMGSRYKELEKIMNYLINTIDE